MSNRRFVFLYTKGYMVITCCDYYTVPHTALDLFKKDDRIVPKSNIKTLAFYSLLMSITSANDNSNFAKKTLMIAEENKIIL